MDNYKENGSFTDIDGKVYKTYSPTPLAGQVSIIDSKFINHWVTPKIELNLEDSPQFVALRDRVIFLENEIINLKKESESNGSSLHKKPKIK